MSWAELSRVAPIGETTLRMIKYATYRPGKWEILVRMESALHWEDGSVERIVFRDGDPVRKTDPERARIDHVWPDLPLVKRRLVADIVETMHRSP